MTNSSARILSYIENQTPNLCWRALEIDVYNFLQINTQTPEMCLYAVKKDGTLLKHVKEQT